MIHLLEIKLFGFIIKWVDFRVIVFVIFAMVFVIVFIIMVYPDLLVTFMKFRVMAYFDLWVICMKWF